MGTYRTHLLTGAACGAVTAWLFPSVPEVTTVVLPILHDIPVGQTAAWIAWSSIIALWPDGDHPASKSFRMLWRLGGCAVIGILGLWWLAPTSIPTMLTSMVGTAWLIPPIWCLITVGLALVLCIWSDGHRKRTHSLVTAAMLAAGAAGAWLLASMVPDPLIRGILSAVWLSTAGLAWGIVCHLPPDLCTASGVPIAYPLRSPVVGKGIVIPEPIVQLVSGLILSFCLIHLWGG
jgi:membrane-bound metal-dependent hydrolase YbcI (DUF457 family)